MSRINFAVMAILCLCRMEADEWISSSIEIKEAYEENISYSLPLAELNLGYTFGEGIETSHDYSTANLMLFPNFSMRCMVPFASLSAHYLDNDRWASTFGGGVR